jgi:hypothetical protein
VSNDRIRMTSAKVKGHGVENFWGVARANGIHPKALGRPSPAQRPLNHYRHHSTLEISMTPPRQTPRQTPRQLLKSITAGTRYSTLNIQHARATQHSMLEISSRVRSVLSPCLLRQQTPRQTLSTTHQGQPNTRCSTLDTITAGTRRSRSPTTQHHWASRVGGQARQNPSP